MPCRRSMIPGSRMQLWTFWADRTYQRDIKPVPTLSCGGVFRYRSGERLHGMQEVSGSIPLFSTKKAPYFAGSTVLFFLLKPIFGAALLRLHHFQKGMFAARFLAGCCIIPFNVRRKVEVEGNVELIPTINIYPADKLIDDHFLCFKTGTVVQVSIGNQLIIQVPVVMRFFHRSAFLQTVPYTLCAA